MTDTCNDSIALTSAKSEARFLFQMWRRNGGALESVRELIRPGSESSDLMTDYRNTVLRFFDQFVAGGLAARDIAPAVKKRPWYKRTVEPVKPRKLSDEKMEAAVKAWESGGRCEDVAARFGISTNTLRRYFRRVSAGAA